MNTFPAELRGTPARLVNAQWGFTAMWTTLATAIEQFHAHAPAMQDGLLLEWREGPRDLKRVTAVEIRALLSPQEGRQAEVVSR